MSTATRVFCPTCNEYALDVGQVSCAWCGGAVRQPEKVRTYRRRRDSKLTFAQVEMAYAAYCKGHSLRAIAAKIYERAGYASARSCTNALHDAFTREGWPLRDRVAATIKASTTHGMGSRDNTAAYRRWKRRRDGMARQCAGVRLGYPRKGERCQRFAMEGSDYCLQHDPARRAEVVERVAHAREGAA